MHKCKHSRAKLLRLVGIRHWSTLCSAARSPGLLLTNSSITKQPVEILANKLRRTFKMDIQMDSKMENGFKNGFWPTLKHSKCLSIQNG